MNFLTVRGDRRWIDYSLKSPDHRRGARVENRPNFVMQAEDPERIRQRREALGSQDDYKQNVEQRQQN